MFYRVFSFQDGDKGNCASGSSKNLAKHFSKGESKLPGYTLPPLRWMEKHLGVCQILFNGSIAFEVIGLISK